MFFYDSYEHFIDTLEDKLVNIGGNKFVLHGEKEEVIFTYDNKPLRHFKLHQHFLAEIDHDTFTLKSGLTGSVWTRKKSGRAVKVNNKTFGAMYMFQILELESAMKDLGWELFLDGYFKEYYSDSWPEIITKIPTGNQILTIAKILQMFKRWPVSGKEFIVEEERLNREAEEKFINGKFPNNKVQASQACIVYFIETSERNTPFIMSHIGWHGLVRVKMRPPTPPSKAQPRPYLEKIDSGELVYLSRITRKEYPLLKEYADSYVYCAIDRIQYEDESYYIQLVIAPPLYDKPIIVTE